MNRSHDRFACRLPLLKRAALRSALVAFALLVALFSSSVPAEESATKRVLLISTGSRLAPGFIMVDQQLLRALREIQSPKIEVYAENLDVVRFPVERTQSIFKEYLAGKYADHPPHLVVLIFVGNLGITAEVLREVFPRTPLIVAGFSEEELPRGKFDNLVSGLVQRVNPQETLEIIQRLHPELRRLVVVGGTAEVDRQILDRVRKAVHADAQRSIEVEFWDGLSMTELRQAVTALPTGSVILYTRLFRDGAGQAFISSEVGRWIGQSASVPVYVLNDASFGTGAVGGAVASVEAFGSRAGELARRMLTGAPQASLPFEIRSDSMPLFDWRALNRWGIPERRLPPGSVIQFRPQSAWTRYRWHIVTALVIILAQSALIAALVVQRRRRLRVQTELHQSHQLMELASDAGELGMWSRESDDTDVWANAAMRKLFGFGVDERFSLRDMMARIHPDDRFRVRAELEHARTAGLPLQTEYRVVLPDGNVRWLLGRGHSIFDAQGRHLRRAGIVIDISERKRMEEQLAESEDVFRRLVESTRAVIWEADARSWLFTYVSPSAVNLLGYPLGRWYEKDFWASCIHPDDRERAVETCLTMSSRLQDFEFEYRMVQASGDTIWVHDVVSCERLGGHRRLRGLLFDVTLRKEAEIALRESEERFRTMANSAPVMIWMSGTDGLCTFFNDGWLSFTGRSLQQELGKGWMEGVHPDDRLHCLTAYESASEGRQAFTIEYRLRRHDGEYRYIMGRGVPRFGTAGTFVGYIGTCSDVTDQKRSEASLERERAFLRQVIDINPNFIFAKDREGRFTLANKAVADAYGITADKLIGRTDADFNRNPDEVAFFRSMDEQVMDTLQEIFIPEEYITEANGNVRWLQTVKRPIVGADGRASQVLGASTDITPRKKAEMELQQQRAEMAHVARVSIMGELSASLAHELNQPLTAILGNASAGLRLMGSGRFDSDELREVLDDIVKATKRASEIISGMRALMKRETPQFVTLDLAGLVGDLVLLLHSDALLHNVRIALELDDDLKPVRGDRIQLQQVMLNILLNAFDAMKNIPESDREITLRVKAQRDGMNHVSITDRGPGLMPADYDNIFQPFYTTKREGLGMGLPICRSIVEAHGGALWAENNPDRGATFHFTVPIAKSELSTSW